MRGRYNENTAPRQNGQLHEGRHARRQPERQHRPAAEMRENDVVPERASGDPAGVGFRDQLHEVIVVTHQEDRLHEKATPEINAHQIDEQVFVRPQPYFAVLYFVHNELPF
jgi:hypothetical protein